MTTRPTSAHSACRPLVQPAFAADNWGGSTPVALVGAAEGVLPVGPRKAKMNKATQIWNRALADYGLAGPALGDRALAAMLLAHGLVMNGGVLHAVEIATNPGDFAEL